MQHPTGWVILESDNTIIQTTVCVWVDGVCVCDVRGFAHVQGCVFSGQHVSVYVECWGSAGAILILMMKLVK